jgi:oligoendopeptidase F
MNRNGYGREDIKKFRENIKKHIVPLCAEVKSEIQKKFGWDKIMSFDDDVYTADEPVPIGTPRGAFEKDLKNV